MEQATEVEVAEGELSAEVLAEREKAQDALQVIAAQPDIVLISPEGRRCTAKADDASEMVTHCGFKYENEGDAPTAQPVAPVLVRSFTHEE